MTIIRALSFSLLTVVAGCGGSTMSAPATLTQVKTDVFKISCNFSSCHDATTKAGGLDLVTDAYTALLNKPATQTTAKTEGLKLVVAGDLTKSFLNTKCTLPTANDAKYGARMPETGQVLAADQLAKLQSWIMNGAKND